MMKTRYKPLHIIGIFLGSVLIYLIANNAFKNPNTSSNIAIFFMLLVVYLFYSLIVFFFKCPVIIFSEDFITRKTFFRKKIYTWNEISDVFLSKKENYSMFLILTQHLETTTIIFNNGDKIVLWNDMYSGLDKIRQQIVEKVSSKIKDPVAVIKNSMLQFFGVKKYTGNPFLTVNALIVIGLFVIVTVLFCSITEYKLSSSFLLLMPVLMYYYMSYEMHYFIIDTGTLVVKNHFLPWKNKTIALNDILEMDIETPYRRPTSLRILTKDYQSKLYSAGSLRQKHWDELEQDLTAIGIPIRQD